MERDYDRLRKRFGLERHARFCDWWMLEGWDSILRYTGFEREAHRVRYGGVQWSNGEGDIVRSGISGTGGSKPCQSKAARVG